MIHSVCSMTFSMTHKAKTLKSQTLLMNWHKEGVLSKEVARGRENRWKQNESSLRKIRKSTEKRKENVKLKNPISVAWWQWAEEFRKGDRQTQRMGERESETLLGETYRSIEQLADGRTVIPNGIVTSLSLSLSRLDGLHNCTHSLHCRSIILVAFLVLYAARLDFKTKMAKWMNGNELFSGWINGNVWMNAMNRPIGWLLSLLPTTSCSYCDASLSAFSLVRPPYIFYECLSGGNKWTNQWITVEMN